MKRIRPFIIGGLVLSTVLPVCAHRIEYYMTNGCIVPGTSLVIDAKVTAAPSNTYYRWQYKTTNGSWTYMYNGSVNINGVNFTVSNCNGTGADNAPALTFSNPTAELDNVQLRCVMRENCYPDASNCSTPTTWGGDGAALQEVKMLRLRYNGAAGVCAISCEENMLTNSTGYYGGFENVSFNSSTYAFTDNNFVSAAGSTDYGNGNGSGQYKVANNPYSVNTAYAKFAPHSGNYQMVVNGNATTSAKIWYKTLTVIPGHIYSFSAWFGTAYSDVPTIQLKAGSTNVGTATAINSTLGKWTQVTGNYEVPSGVTSVVFAITNTSSNAADFTIDDICITDVTPDNIEIGDRVWFDVNRNATQDAGEPGVSGVTVKLFADANGDNIADNSVPVQTAVTDANGYYLFSNVVAGSYFVQFPIPVPSGYTGYTTQSAAGVPAAEWSSCNVSTGKTGTHNFQSNYYYKDAGLLKNIQLSGNVYQDNNALSNNMVDGTLISSAGGSQLYANLFSGSTFIASQAINSGTYNFQNLAGNKSYTVIVSTAQAVAGSALVSTIPANWMNTGENVGNGSGSDGIADGKLDVTLGASSISNLNFGMQQRPTPKIVALPDQYNPGDTTSVIVPTSSFGGTDEGGGTIASLRIISFPTAADRLIVANNVYTSGSFPLAGITIATTSAGEPTSVIRVDPVDGAVIPLITYRVTDNGGAESSTNGTVSVPLKIPPDLIPQITASPTTTLGITNLNIQVRVSNILQGPTNGPVTVLIPRDSRLTISYNPTATSVGTYQVNNSAWTYSNSNPFYHVFTSTQTYSGLMFDMFGFTGQFNPQNADGVYILSAIIVAGSGGEIRTSNNTSSTNINYYH